MRTIFTLLGIIVFILSHIQTVQANENIDEDDPCEPNPCLNEGTCTNVTNTNENTNFTCKCTEGYSGNICEIDDPCVPNPCLNEGTCTNITNTNENTNFTCKCTEGYSGNICEIDDPCVPNPCQNGATCTNITNTNENTNFTCNCTERYSGNICVIETNVRLVNGTNPREGRVEYYYNGEWGTVCDDLWGPEEATVVCRQLGFNMSQTKGIPQRNAFFGEGSGNIWFSKMGCRGTESILRGCNHPGSTNYCRHIEDAGVICANATIPEELSVVRLVDGIKDSKEGRVEIFYNGEWGTVCNDEWGPEDASVVCRQLGFNMSRTKAIPKKTIFGEGTGKIWIDDADCIGNESLLIKCKHSGFIYENCGHGEDAGVICADATIPEELSVVRLVNGTNSREGRVEIYYNGEWGTVCSDYWGPEEAAVVCRQLGFNMSRTKAIPKIDIPFGDGPGKIWIDEAECIGNESLLINCKHDGFIAEDCEDDDDDAGVICADATIPEELSVVRLVNGTNSREGRVEIYYNGEWGTVCDDGWGPEDASVVCRQLGYMSKAIHKKDAFFGEGTGKIWIDEADCIGNESLLIRCEHKGFIYEDCDHDEDAGVICSIYCDPGYVINTATLKCDACDYGFYQNDYNQTECIACVGDNKTTIAKASTSEDQCVVYCDPGKELVNDSCVDCERGFYKTNDVNVLSKCVLCDDSFTTDDEGSTSSDDCNIKACQLGRHRVEGVCFPCPIGTYRDGTRHICQQCKSSETTLKTGATSQSMCVDKCEPGIQYYVEHDECRECPTGQYKDDTMSFCNKCPEGQTTMNTGSTSCIKSHIMETPVTLRTTFTLNAFFSGRSDICSGHIEQLIGLIRTIMTEAVKAQATLYDAICSRAGCANVETTVQICTDLNTDGKKRSADVTFAESTTVVRDIPLEVASSTARRETEKVLDEALYDRSLYEDRLRENYVQLNRFTLNKAPACEEGQERPADTEPCVDCPAGTSYNKVTFKCVECPQGYYQPSTKQMSCTKCPGVKTTASTKSTFESDCRPICEIYPGYCLNGGTCKASDGRAACDCTETYEGDKCDVKKENTADMSGLMGAIISGCIALVILIILIVACSIYFRKRNKDKTTELSSISSKEEIGTLSPYGSVYSSQQGSPYVTRLSTKQNNRMKPLSRLTFPREQSRPFTRDLSDDYTQHLRRIDL